MIASVAFFILTVTELGFCQNSCDPETRFQCPGGLCFSRAKVCNNVRDCADGEDERNCESAYCMTRNLTMAKLNKYTACRKQCLSDDDCSGRKTCVCDDECGKSCLNSDAECGPPPRITNMKSFWVYGGQIPRRIRSRSYRHGSYVKYICKSGFTLKGPVPRCNGRKQWSGERPTCVGTSCVGMWPNIPHAQYKGPPHLYGTGREIGDVLKYKCDEGYTRVGGEVTCGPDAQWTKFRCVVTCLKAYDYTAEIRLELTCGRQCETDSDCLRGEFCKCDGPCSRVCVSENMDCGMAPTVAHANVTINGSIARYECHEGYYLASGKLTVHCIGSGNIWDNSNRPVCEPVLCGDPSASIEETRGRLIDERNFYYYDTVVNFSCPRDYKLTGSPTRRCMSNGQWSGELTVCHIRDRNQDRCPHPGRPINGQIIGNVIGNIGDIVRFECDEGYIMYGLAVQECLWFREWSGSRTPECVDYRYPHTASNLIGTLTRSLENLPDVEIGVHRSINLNDMNEKHEIYLMFDISETVLFVENQLDNEIKFAIRLVRRLESFGENVPYCIILFASECITLRNVSTSGQNADEVVEQLLDILSDVRARTYDKMRPAGRATSKALYEVQTQIDLNYEEEPSRKKHVFMFVGGKDTEDENPVDIKRTVEASYENTEFYSITACSICNKAVIEQLKLLSTSKEEDGKNFIQLEDFYKLSHYLDKVTDVNKDYSECGKSGNQESVKKLASTVEEVTDKGENAEEDAWRWQVLITERDTSMAQTVSQDTNIIGGGSIINEHWVLTAAHVLNRRLPFSPEDTSWMDEFALFVGIVDRPTRINELKKSVKAYEMKSYKEHPGFTWNFDNDIALIEVGARLQDDMTSTYEGEGLTFGYYVRPVCLPCTGTCVTNEHLADVGGVSYDSMNDDERCKAEETFLLDHYAMTIVTGFGHTEKEVKQSRRINLAKRLQMVLLRIARNITCEDGMTALKQIRQSYRYTDKMICCKSGSPLKPYGACRGDSGGALVRRVRHRGGTGNREKNDYCWVAIGIVSFGIGCASGEHPGYYTNVARYVQWIHMIINDSGCTDDPPMIEHADRVQVFKNDMQGNPVPIMLAPYPYGSYATYYCDPSYRLEEPSMSCNIRKEWEGQPTCVGIPCEAPTDEPNSYSIARNFIAGNYYNFRCQLGYYMDGNSTRLCQAGRLWSTLQHRCNITTCNPLGEISNGRIETVGLNFGSKASVRCNSGYRTTSTSQMRCSADPHGLRFAKWLGRLPSCIRIRCPMPEPPRNGFIRNIKRVKLQYGSSIDFQCNPGYKLKGPAHGTCNDMEEWGEKPLCIVDLDCDFVNSFCGYGARNWERLRSMGAERNEEPVIRSLGESYLESSEVPRGWTNHFVCLKFYYKLSERGRLNVERMNGTVLWATHTNEEIGKWSNASQTIDASSGLQFRFHANKDDIMIYEITANGEECENHCILSPCQNGGTCYNRINGRKCFCTVEFTGDDCSVVSSCPDPEPPENGFIRDIEWLRSQYGARIDFQCNPGYELQGPAHATCNARQEWREKPKCRVNLNCDFGRSFCGYGARDWERLFSMGAEGYEDQVVRSLRESYLESLEVPRGWTDHFVCLKFYFKLPRRGVLKVERMDGSVLWKTHINEEIGQWSNSALTIDASSGIQFRFHANKYGIMIYEITADTEECENHCLPSPCQNGGTCYNKINNWKCFCTEEYTGDDCSIDRRCNTPNLEIENGFRLSLGSRMPDSTFRYKCNENYTFDWRPGVVVKEKIISCHEYTARRESLWEPSPSSLRCGKITCSDLTVKRTTVLENSEHSQGGWTVGETAIFRCLYGYKKGASPMRITCLKTGKWSHASPTCVLSHCKFTNRDNEVIVVNQREQYPVGSKIFFKCKVGFKLTEFGGIQCTERLQWNKDPPSCTPVQCVGFPAIANSISVRRGPSHFGDIVNISCSEGFFIHGPRQVKCKWDRNWTERPTCMRGSRVCENPPSVPLHGSIEIRGGKVKFSCDKLFCMKGPSEMNCGSDEVWHGKPPICEVCPDAVAKHQSFQYLAFTSNELKSNYSEAQEYCHRIGGNLAVLYYTNPILGELDKNMFPELGNYGRMYIAYRRAEDNSTEYNWDIKNISIRLPFWWEGWQTTRWQIGKPEPTGDGCVVIQYKPQPEQSNKWTNIECSVKAGFICQRYVNPCFPNPCMNGGNCIRSGSLYRCECLQTFRGRNCDQEISCDFTTFVDRGFKPLHKNRFLVGNIEPLKCQGVQSGRARVGEQHPNQAKCLGSGTWTNTDTWCAAKSCPFPNVPRDMRLSSDQRNRRIGQIVYIRCTEGEMSGRDWMQCLLNGTWTANQGRCTIPTTASPPVTTPPRTSIVPTTTPAPTTTPSHHCQNEHPQWCRTLERHCDKSFNVRTYCKKMCGLCEEVSTTTPAPTTTPYHCQNTFGWTLWCQSSKRFCDSSEFVRTNCEKTCGLCKKAITCPRITVPYHTFLINHREQSRRVSAVGETATFSCAYGFKKSADSVMQITCLNTGSWSHAPPTCVRPRVCSTPTLPSNTIQISDPGDNFPVGSQVQLSCREGFVNHGVDTLTLTCTEFLTWRRSQRYWECRLSNPTQTTSTVRSTTTTSTTPEPPCEFPKLPQFTIIDGFDDQADEFPSGTVLDLKCQSTHVRIGTNHQWRCISGEWEKSDTKCMYGDIYRGEKQCEEGMFETGEDGNCLRCNGWEWIKSSTTCSGSSCGFPRFPQFTLVDNFDDQADEFPSGTAFDLTCQKTHVRIGANHRWRCNNGTWMESDTKCVTFCKITVNELPRYIKVGSYMRRNLDGIQFPKDTALNLTCKGSRNLINTDRSTTTSTITCTRSRWIPSYRNFKCDPSTAPAPTPVVPNRCQDTDGNCQGYEKNSCKTRSSYMKANCKKFCGLCEGVDERK